jgi:hypothetical protein
MEPSYTYNVAYTYISHVDFLERCIYQPGDVLSMQSGNSLTSRGSNNDHILEVYKNATVIELRYAEIGLPKLFRTL